MEASGAYSNELVMGATAPNSGDQKRKIRLKIRAVSTDSNENKQTKEHQ